MVFKKNVESRMEKALSSLAKELNDKLQDINQKLDHLIKNYRKTRYSPNSCDSSSNSSLSDFMH